jgi:glycerol-3-phosphate acyltransferase PlsX
MKLGRLDGVKRPAIAARMPSRTQDFVLLDAGANDVCEPLHLAQFAVMGNIYSREVLGRKKPRVGVLSIGTEECKGNDLTLEAFKLCKKLDLNFIGNVEGHDLFKDHVDVVVCDGFVGNIMLKSWESLVRFFSNMLREELQLNPMRATGALLSKGAFNALKERINPERYGGAPLLGLNGNILKAHGSSNRHAIKSAIHAASMILKADLNQRIIEDIGRANDLLRPPTAA